MFGSVKFFNHQRGFGFIIPEDGGKDLFFHVSECQDEYEPQEHDRVQYVVISTPKGEAASEVRFVGGADATADVDGEEVEETQEEDVAEAA